MLVGGRFWGIGTSCGCGGSTSTSTSTSFPTPYPFYGSFGHSSFSNKYALFSFVQGGQTLYGWMQLSFTVSGQFGGDPAFGPELTIHDFAFDDSGALIGAGQTAVPEPSTLASTGLAALALGAVGLRSWRKNRKAA